MADQTEFERRNRAFIALIYLMRDLGEALPDRTSGEQGGRNQSLTLAAVMA